MGGLLKEKGPRAKAEGLVPPEAAQESAALLWFPPLASPYSLPGRQLSLPSSPLPSPSHPNKVSSRPEARMNFLEPSVVTSGEGLYIQSPEAPDATQTQDHQVAHSEEDGACKTLAGGRISSTWLLENYKLPPVPIAYRLVQILQTLVPNYSILCLLSDFLVPDQPESKGWGARSQDPFPPPLPGSQETQDTWLQQQMEWE